jgi:hypothetical protein
MNWEFHHKTGFAIEISSKLAQHSTASVWPWMRRRSRGFLFFFKVVKSWKSPAENYGNYFLSMEPEKT